MTLEDIYGPVISSYSREQAFEDGVLVDLMQPDTVKAVREAGFKIPVAMTLAAFCQTVSDVDHPDGKGGLLPGQDPQGRLWHVLSMLRHAIRRTGDVTTIGYSLIVQHQSDKPWASNERRRRGKHLRLIALKAVCGPADDASPCITIMQPDEE